MKKLVTLVFVLGIFGCSENQNVQTDVLTDSSPSNIQFVDVSKSCGIDFKHIATYSDSKHLPEIMGGGVAVADFNRDGSPDILLVNSGDLKKPARPENSKNRLYLNDGKGNFSDETDAWNLKGRGYGQGVAVGDVNNDGFIDVFLTNFEGTNQLLQNNGEKFEDVTAASGILSDGKWATSAGFFDYDKDGDLDLYIVRYVKYSMTDPHKVYRNRMQIYAAPIYFDAEPDQLWRNDGDGTFTDITKEAGLSEKKNGLALAIGDIDKDGDEDVYVANDSDANFLWINDKGNFKEMAQISGSAYGKVGKEQGSMGADFSDVDNNNMFDIAVTNFQQEPTALYVQEDKLFFNEASDTFGIGEAARQRLSFGIDFFDADNDGDEDLLVANGHVEDNIGERSKTVTFAQQNTLYLNAGDGKFTDISNLAGNALKDVQVSRGLAIADFDSDGDLDYIVTNNAGTAQVAFNNTKDKGNFVGLLLEGNGKTNRSAIGTRLVAKIGDKTIERQIMGSLSYLSVSDFRVLFGLGKAEKIDELKIHWLGGEVQTLSDIGTGKYYYLKQGKPLTKLEVGKKVAP